ncbi:MAG: response regulator [Burkholderiales bacterium]|nr:MAG: response regulator [Burkholderiales bacterium]
MLVAACCMPAAAQQAPVGSPVETASTAAPEASPDVVVERGMWVDVSDRVTIDEAEHQTFSPVKGVNAFVGYPKHPVWFKLRLKPTSAGSDHWLWLWPAFIESAVLFQKDAQGVWRPTPLGLNDDHRVKLAPNLGPAFPLQLQQDRATTVYLRLQANVATVKLAVVPLGRAMATELGFSIIYSTYLGLVILAISVSLLAYMITRQTLWLTTAAYDFAAIVHVSLTSGLAAAYFAPGAEHLLSGLHVPSGALLLFAVANLMAHIALILQAPPWVQHGYRLSRVVPLVGLLLYLMNLPQMAMIVVTTAAVGLSMWSFTLLVCSTQFDRFTVRILRAQIAASATYTLFFLGPWASLRPEGFDFLYFAAMIPLNLNAMAMAMLIAFRMSLIEARGKARLKQEALALERDRAAAVAQAQAKSDFLAYISHEIRTPLNVVVGLAELANSHQISPDERKQYLDMLVESAGSLTLVVSDVLDMSKMEAGKLAIEPVDFSLADLTTSLQTTYAALAQRQGLSFSVEVQGEVEAAGMVRGDSLRILQILNNYLSNAFKFTAAGSVRLVVRRSGEQRLRFEVHDTGRGLTAPEQARLFQAYAQAGEDKFTKARGTGLGLAISRDLAHLMGGDVGVSSLHGQGSCFWLELPLPPADRATAAPPRPVTNRSAFEGSRILIVEDDDRSRQVLVDLLARQGATPVGVSDGDAALQAIRGAFERGQPFDIVFLDIHLRHKDGIAVVREVRALGPAGQLPVVALTGSVISDELHAAQRAGMNDIVSKPVRLARLQEVMRRLVAKPPP